MYQTFTISTCVLHTLIRFLFFFKASHRDEAILDLSLEYAGDISIIMEAMLINEHFPTVKGIYLVYARN